jgi:hypothetical protein
MAANLDMILPCKINQRVCVLEPVFVWCRMNIRPLHLALGDDDLANAGDCGAIGRIGRQRAGTHSRTVRNRH